MVTTQGTGHTTDPVEQALEVVGLYGDPDTHWGFGLELTFTVPMDLSGAAGRLRSLVDGLPHLGAVPEIEVYPESAWADGREQKASATFGADGHLLRVMVSEDARSLYIAAHHGVVDGLGTLAIGEAVSGFALRSHAPGIGDRQSSRGFFTSSLLRLWEAVVSPPAGSPGLVRAPRKVLTTWS